MPNNPHQIIGIITSPNRGGLDSATLVFTNSSGDTMSVLTDTSGLYIADLANLASYSNGETISVKATKLGFGNKTTTFIVNTLTEPQRLDISLQISTFYPIDRQTVAAVVKSIPTHFDGADVTYENPLAVDSDAFLFKAAIEYSGSNPIYIGLAKPGSSKGDPVWRILKLTFSGSNPTDVEFANGNDDFANIWNNRSSLSYS